MTDTPKWCGEAHPHAAHEWHERVLLAAVTIDCPGSTGPSLVGICGDRPPSLINDPSWLPPVCTLGFGHTGCHESHDGCYWTEKVA